jgi:ribosomal protein S18 acetylase RimI-like enzyme
MSHTAFASPSLPVTLRPLTRADEPFLWEMLYLAIHIESGANPPPRDIVRQPDLARYVANWGRLGDSGVVAIDGEKQVGAAWLRLFTASDKGYGYIADNIPELSTAMLPNYRGKGVGTLLLSRILDSVRAGKNYAAISLSVSPTNPAVRLYERLGFKTVGISGTSLVMRLNL